MSAITLPSLSIRWNHWQHGKAGTFPGTDDIQSSLPRVLAGLPTVSRRIAISCGNLPRRAYYGLASNPADRYKPARVIPSISSYLRTTPPCTLQSPSPRTPPSLPPRAAAPAAAAAQAASASPTSASAERHYERARRGYALGCRCRVCICIQLYPADSANPICVNSADSSVCHEALDAPGGPQIAGGSSWWTPRLRGWGDVVYIR